MDQEFGISARDVEAAEAETARKLAADRAVELESPALRTYVSQNPDADMTLLKFMDEMKTRSDLAAQESRQQVDALSREDIRPDGEEFVRSVKISHRREPDGKYTELIRIIHEVLGASVENYDTTHTT